MFWPRARRRSRRSRPPQNPSYIPFTCEAWRDQVVGSLASQSLPGAGAPAARQERVDEVARTIGFRDATLPITASSSTARSSSCADSIAIRLFPLSDRRCPLACRSAMRRSCATNSSAISCAPRTIRSRAIFSTRAIEIGLLVLEEIPGWQHIGDEAWQQISVDNVEPHDSPRLEPSVDHPVGRAHQRVDRTITISTTQPMQLAHKLDPSTADGRHPLLPGVGIARRRVHDERLRLAPEAANHSRYLNTEFVGHTYPTKTIDAG